MRAPRVIVLAGYGINCQEETAAAYRLAGAEPAIVYLPTLLSGAASIHEYDLLHLPGGFSFGDDLGAGKILANKLRYHRLPDGRTMLSELRRFLEEGKFIFGVCNGFQALVHLGILPNLRGDFSTSAAFLRNDSDRFEDRWCFCRVSQLSPRYLAGLEVIELPVRHSEGKLIFNDRAVAEEVLERQLNVLSYCDAQGQITASYPDNPNGAQLNCAALRDPSGQVLGMMPHPEAALSLFNHPDWPRRRREHPNFSEDGVGLTIFRQLVNHLREKDKDLR